MQVQRYFLLLVFMILQGCNPSLEDEQSSACLFNPTSISCKNSSNNSGITPDDYLGCTEQLAKNHDKEAMKEDGSCEFEACMNEQGENYSSYDGVRTAFKDYLMKFENATLHSNDDLCGDIIDDSSPQGHEYGVPITGGSGDSGRAIPVRFIFFRSGSNRITQNAQADGELAIQKINERFQSHDGHQHIRFELLSSDEIDDPLLYNIPCNGSPMISIENKYGTTDAMTMTFHNHISGCAGASWLWVFPDMRSSVTIAEYKHSFHHNSWTAVVHEFAHSFGFDHTRSAPSGPSGLLSFNSKPRKRSSRRCQQDFGYFIDNSVRSQTYVTEDGQFSASNNGGVLHNSHHHTMFPSFGRQPDTGFFGSPGYHYATSHGFDCWYNLAIANI